MATKDALKAEATENESIQFNYNGHTYEMPHPDEWDIEVAEAHEEGKVVTALRRILGEEQWKLFKEREKPKSKDLDAFLKVMFDKTGMEPGE